jgi:hypothetical protein
VALDHLSVSTLAYALLSLTVLRMVPVALALLGAGLDGWTIGFVGWFGPRGLASVVFALLAVEELGETPLIGEAIAVVALTVLLSVVLHGCRPGRSGVATSWPKPPANPPSSRGHDVWGTAPRRPRPEAATVLAGVPAGPTSCVAGDVGDVPTMCTHRVHKRSMPYFSADRWEH